MNFDAVLEQFNNWYFWLGFGLGEAVLIFVSIFLILQKKESFVTWFYVVMLPIITTAYLLNLQYLFYISLAVYVIGTSALIYSDIVAFRTFITNMSSRRDKRYGRNVPEKRKFRKIYDYEKVFQEIAKAVDYLTRTRTGALITVEKSMLLDDIIKNGKPINAPVTSELLTTIFYKGTTLHDGAVVIRDDMIIAASVYYIASTKPLSGKVGSRHRAGLGISEITDSVTIVVSEETGRISIAYKGNLQPVNRDDFYKTFVEYMDLGNEEN